ncbi:MAG: sensor domain-containing diguanylate cyclase [Deltaproteobacteria bacterium]|nr:sensor domain-containing diguanylate cyclase [Deltaproteobacteria bacterium]
MCYAPPMHSKQTNDPTGQAFSLAEAPASVLLTLLEVTTALTSTLDLDLVLGEMLTRTVSLARATAGTLVLVDERRNAVRRISARWSAPFEVSETVLQQVLSSGLAGWVIGRLRLACVADTRQDERWLKVPDAAYEPRSAICLPVLRHGRVLGVLTLTHELPDRFSGYVVELLEAVAAQSAIAIENARLFAEVQRLATTDGLTGLLNRRHFFEQAERECVRAVGHRRPISAILLDVDRFKAVNDGWGHATGDEVLAGVAARLRQALGSGPVLLARYGGEEFAVLLPGQGEEQARLVAEQLRCAVGDLPLATGAGSLQVTISLGVAEAPPGQPASISTLLRQADARLYAAKAAGKNCVR